ncbi:DLA class II histocompatibility antigen, DR-1 beta chain-like [Mobula birostris]|uniref:DLA class II histocompatibility antigen, DR-1 beta chain-like n=1 Tax=Mobula birostris TaxID=1983395 RepID=UPI003B27B3CC
MPFAMEIVHQAVQALTAKPTITITSRHLKNRENNLALTCQVHGFYPKKIHATWLRNGVAIDQEVLMTKILPNQDRMFQVRLQVEIDPGKGDTYTCEIEHLSVPDKLHAVWGAVHNPDVMETDVKSMEKHLENFRNAWFAAAATV